MKYSNIILEAWRHYYSCKRGLEKNVKDLAGTLYRPLDLKVYHRSHLIVNHISLVMKVYHRSPDLKVYH